ncbi:hypothetical protein BXZ70DRAFT_595424 [Cristinia sonorae]|uniref:DUF6699 domain-containing protein n=1 Tax=Cristinia sonorae TaxID=1940300 RepID=A0A8K0UUG4_9AGAR|nr:hypothetical protein BXZ70DRAFT_595424 [Cristinia sonorae]
MTHGRSYSYSSIWEPRRPSARLSPYVLYEPTTVHHYNPNSLPRKSALKRHSQFSVSPHFYEKELPPCHSSIHHLLASSDRPALLWDISTRPENIVLPYSRGGDARLLLSEPATDTPSPKVELVYQDALWRTRFTVHAGDARHGFSKRKSFVTVGDILYSLYDQFRKPVYSNYYDELFRRAPHLKRGVEDAHRDRCRHGNSIEREQRELKAGLRLVDLFMGSLTWVGLTYGESFYELRLHVRPGRPVY